MFEIDDIGLNEESRFIILRAPYYKDIVAELEKGVRQAMRELQKEKDFIEDAKTISVSGALELPFALSMIMDNEFHYTEEGNLGVIVLGCVLRGETEHFSLICREVFSGLQRVAIKHSLPLGTGVLACDSEAQAKTRAEKLGRQAFFACLDLLMLRQGFERE